MLNLVFAARGVADNFIVGVECGKEECGALWRDALRYQDKTVVRCPKCASYNVIDSSGIRYIDGLGVVRSLEL